MRQVTLSHPEPPPSGQIDCVWYTATHMPGVAPIRQPIFIIDLPAAIQSLSTFVHIKFSGHLIHDWQFGCWVSTYTTHHWALNTPSLRLHQLQNLLSVSLVQVSGETMYMGFTTVMLSRSLFCKNQLG